MDPEGKFVRAFDDTRQAIAIADALRELMAQPREGGAMGVRKPR